MKLVTRSEWGARPPDYVNAGNLSDKSTCHWNGPTVRVNGSLTWSHVHCASLVRGIQNFHMDSRGWSDIAYNFVECPHGYTFEGRGLNVFNGANGTILGNRTSHAICCLAGEENAFPEAEKVGFKAAIKYISYRTAAPDACKGHRDHKATACPGNARYAWVHAGMPVALKPPTKPTPPTTIPKDDDDMAVAVRGNEEPAVYATNWIHKKHIPNRDRMRQMMMTGLKTNNGVEYVVDQATIDAIPDAT